LARFLTLKVKSPKAFVDEEGEAVIIAIMVLFILMAGFAFAYTYGIGSVRISLPSGNILLKSAEDYELERKHGPLAPIINSFSDLFSGGGGGEKLGNQGRNGVYLNYRRVSRLHVEVLRG